MLSSKKTTLVSCVLQSITSDAQSNPRHPSSHATSHSSCGPQQVSNKSTPSPSAIQSSSGSLWTYLLSMCCYTNPPQPQSHTHVSDVSQSDANHPTRLLEEVNHRLHQLSKRDLKRLLRLIQNRGSCKDVGECILVHQLDYEPCQPEFLLARQPRHPIMPHLLVVGLWWRWPLGQMDQLQLRSLPCCSHSSDRMWDDISKRKLLCINPYHWSLLILPNSREDFLNDQTRRRCHPSPSEHRRSGQFQLDYRLPGFEPNSPPDQYYPIPSSTPPPSYSEAFNNNHQLSAPHKRNSQKSLDCRQMWCILKYWEKRTHVGEMFKVCSPSVDVSLVATEENGNGFSLAPLFSAHLNVSSSISHVRGNIGLGVTIFRDASNNVFLYNRSLNAVFVSSHTLNPPMFRSAAAPDSPVKVPPGHCLKAYDFELAQQLRSALQTNTHTTSDDHPSRFHHILHNASFTLSFQKGFGSNYSRPDILHCPCWLEVLLDFPHQ